MCDESVLDEEGEGGHLCRCHRQEFSRIAAFFDTTSRNYGLLFSGKILLGTLVEAFPINPASHDM